MTIDDFTSTSIALLRTAVGWQTRIAERLGVDSRTVRRWLHAREVPPWAAKKLAELVGAADLASPFPRDEWMAGGAVGEDGRIRDYVVHLQPPRFVARVVTTDDEGLPYPDDEPADVVSGVRYVALGDDEGDILLCELAWIDEPDPGEIVHWMEAASDYYTVRHAAAEE